MCRTPAERWPGLMLQWQFAYRMGGMIMWVVTQACIPSVTLSKAACQVAFQVQQQPVPLSRPKGWRDTVKPFGYGREGRTYVFPLHR